MAAISDILPQKAELPKVQLPEVDMPHIDLGATLAEAAEAVGLQRPARRSRWLVPLGGVILALVAGWGLSRSPQVRARAQQLVRSMRERLATIRPNAFDFDGDEATDPIAFPAAETKPIEPDRWNDTEDVAAPDYPDGLGSEAGDRVTAREQSSSRA